MKLWIYNLGNTSAKTVYVVTLSNQYQESEVQHVHLDIYEFLLPCQCPSVIHCRYEISQQ